MDEGALPQRSNARRRMRQSCQPALTQSKGLSERDVWSDQATAGVGDSAAVADVPETSNRSAAHPTKSYGKQDLTSTIEETGYAGEDNGGYVVPAYRSAAVGSYKFEYLDHTADVQLHAWGIDLKEAFENCALAMFNYMSPLQHVQPRQTRSYRAEGHDLPSLLYSFLDELLFVFATELFLAAEVQITKLDRREFVIEAEGRGDTFDRLVHEVGTEIKAITYSAMSIVEREDERDAEVFVIVDI